MVVIQYRMRLTILLLALCAVYTNTKQIDKEETTTSTPLPDLPKNAIIAIEVVDPKENSTKDGNGRKRTIESALGYGYNDGYQNFFNVKPKPPKYEVYKYSQHDIPAYKGSTKNTQVDSYSKYNHAAAHSTVPEGSTAGGHANTAEATSYSHQDIGLGNDYHVQKSIQYDLGSSAPVYQAPQHQIQSQHEHHDQHGPNPKHTATLQQYYQNGATLFSSLDNGQLSSLSTQVPTNRGPTIPVIILRVYTNQLGQNALHANIPPGHPYAKLNSIDLQSLLAGYVQNHPQGGHQQYYGAGHTQPQQQPQPEYYQSASGLVEASHEHTQSHYQVAHSQQTHHNHDQHHGYQHHTTGLLTNENYPDDAHTKVIFTKPASGGSKTRVKQKKPTQKFKITIPENTYSKVEVQEHIYGGPHDAGQYVQQQVEYAQPQGHADEQQQYYYQQQYQYQHQPQQEYQSSVQSEVQYQQIPQVPISGKEEKYLQSGHQAQELQRQNNHQLKPVQQVQPGKQVPYGPAQEVPVVHSPPQKAPQQQPGYYQQHYNAKQYVQIATYPSNTNLEEHQQQPQHSQSYQTQLSQYQQSQQPQAIPVKYYQQYLQYHPHADQNAQTTGYQNPTGTEVQYLQRPPEQGTENQDYSIVKHSNDAGRDLHPKLYNYHAHDGAPKKKRERKLRKGSRVPLVLAPEVMETLEKKQ